MKFLLSVLLVYLFVFPSYTLAADNAAQNICQYIAADDRNRLRSFLKTKRLKIRKIFDDISCNGQNLLLFADGRSSLATADFLISKLPKGKVKKNIAAITSADVLAMAKKRVE